MQSFIIIFPSRNAFHTLFVGRLSYETSEKRLRREMDQYGPVKKIVLVEAKDGKPRGSSSVCVNIYLFIYILCFCVCVLEPRFFFAPIDRVYHPWSSSHLSPYPALRCGLHNLGYAFVEYENEEDMAAAYRKSDGKKLDGMRIVVDCERGRCVCVCVCVCVSAYACVCMFMRVCVCVCVCCWFITPIPTQCHVAFPPTLHHRTVRGWRPRRLGGGKGGRKSIKGKAEIEVSPALLVRLILFVLLFDLIDLID